MAQILPKELRLFAPPTMPQARSYLFKQQSTQSSYKAGEVIQINIPRLQRSYLTKDSYLKCRIKVNAKTKDVDSDTNKWVNGSAVFDTCGAFGLIDKIEVFDYLGSTLLESTAGHGQLMTLLMDTSVNTLETNFHYSNTTGTTEYPTIHGPQCGGVIAQAGQGTTTEFTGEFSIPLLSFLGLLSTKYAPLHNGYTIVITLNSIANAIGFSAREQVVHTPASGETPAYDTSTIAYGSMEGKNDISVTLDNVYFCAQVLELGALAESMVLSSTGGQPLVVHSKAFRNYVGTINEKTANYRLDLNLNVASLTNVLWFMRPSDCLNNIERRSLSARIRNYLSKWYFQYGSSILPQTSGIVCGTSPGYYTGTGGSCEAYNELIKARHALNQPNHHSVIGFTSYNVDSIDDYYKYLREVRMTDSAFHPVPRFALGLDLELVSGKSNELVCGLNTNGMLTSIFAEFNPTEIDNVAQCRLDAYCEYDQFISVVPGVATTVSF